VEIILAEDTPRVVGGFGRWITLELGPVLYTPGQFRRGGHAILAIFALLVAASLGHGTGSCAGFMDNRVSFDVCAFGGHVWRVSSIRRMVASSPAISGPHQEFREEVTTTGCDSLA
jgi:hypothetical protein